MCVSLPLRPLALWLSVSSLSLYIYIPAANASPLALPAPQFAVYEWLKKIATASNSSTPQAQPPLGGQSAWVSVLSGGTAKIVASTVTYPYQVIKSRLQQREATVLSSVGPPGRLRRYRGMVDCIVKVCACVGVFLLGVLLGLGIGRRCH